MKQKFIACAFAAAMAVDLAADVITWRTGTEFDVDRDGVSLPKAGDVLDILISSYKSMRVNAVGDPVSFDGTVVITNRTAATPHPEMLVYRANRTFSGNGGIIADAVRIDTGVTLTYCLKSLKIGYGIMEDPNTTAAKYVFPDGIEFGTWGDWSNKPDAAETMVDVELAGDVSFDTRNCFDGETTHSILLGAIKDTGMTSLAATGGGTVALQIAAGFASELKRLEVGAGTTLDLTGVGKRIFVGDLVLGAGAVLKFDAFTSPIEVVGELSVDPSARIEASVSGSLSSGTLYHVLDSVGALPGGVLSCDAPGGWTLASNGGCRYLDDGNRPAPPASGCYWIGGVSSQWTDGQNWANGAIPGSGSEVNFSRVTNSVVVYTHSGNYKGQMRKMTFEQSCGPFLVSGDTLTPSYGSASSQSLRTYSSFPVVVSNFMACASDPGGCFLNDGGSFVALVGGGSSKGSIRYRGDVRFGGVWTATNVIEMAGRPSGSRETRLTILKGGTFDMSAATGTVSLPGSLRIDGSMVLGGVTADLSGMAWNGVGDIKAAGDATLSFGTSLTLAPGATLGIDTEDPVTHAGHSVSISEPIVGGGNVVKKGAGTLVLGTGGSSIGGRFELTGGAIAPGGALASAKTWTRLFTAASFAGIRMADGYSIRIVDAGNGLKALEFRETTGLVITFR